MRFENLHKMQMMPLRGENRYFLLSESNPIEQTAGQLMVFFEWRPLTDKKKEALGKISQQRVGLVVLTTQFEPLMCVCAPCNRHTRKSEFEFRRSQCFVWIRYRSQESLRIMLRSRHIVRVMTNSYDVATRSRTILSAFTGSIVTLAPGATKVSQPLTILPFNLIRQPKHTPCPQWWARKASVLSMSS